MGSRNRTNSRSDFAYGKHARRAAAFKGSSARRRRHVHPFPARMAPAFVQWQLRSIPKGAVLLDPMCGSGIVLQAGAKKGLGVVGFDTDPLAVLMTRVGLRYIEPDALIRRAGLVLERARLRKSRFRSRRPWLAIMEKDAGEYVEFWFDKQNRLELTALAVEIGRVRERAIREALWIALSNMIIVKKNGVSRAMDVAHSRPHRSYKVAPVRAFGVFEASVRGVAAVVSKIPRKTKFEVNQGDARRLEIEPESVDLVLTSPPYFNAIDYVRGHRLSLVWLGHSLDDLRGLRITNIGTERSDIVLKVERPQLIRDIATSSMSGQSPTPRLRAMVEKYTQDMWEAIGGIASSLKKGGRAVYVTGDCEVYGVRISNEKIMRECAVSHGLQWVRTTFREIPASNRYLPPPSVAGKNHLAKRMRKESVSTFFKPQGRVPSLLRHHL